MVSENHLPESQQSMATVVSWEKVFLDIGSSYKGVGMSRGEGCETIGKELIWVCIKRQNAQGMLCVTQAPRDLLLFQSVAGVTGGGFVMKN